MILYLTAKLFTLWLCLVTVNGLDGLTSEYVNEDRITRLSNHIENLKNLLDRSQRYNNNNQLQSSWPNIYNRQTDYDEYLRQYYIKPIFNSLRELSEQVNIITPPNSLRPYFGQFPGQFATPSPPIFGAVGGWGVSIPSFTQAHRISGDSGTLLSLPPNQNTNRNDTTASQPTGYGVVDRFPIPLNIPASEQSFGTSSGQSDGSTSGQSFGTSSGQSLGAVSGRFGSTSEQSFEAGQSFGTSGGQSLGAASGPSFGTSSGQSFGSGQSVGTSNGQSISSLTLSSSSSDTQLHGFGSNLPLYSQTQQNNLGNAPSNKQYHDPGSSSYFGGQSSYANSKPALSLSNRYPGEDDDSAKNWGLVDTTDDDDDNIRPISLKSKTSAQSDCNCDACYNRNTKSSPKQLLRTVPKTAITCKAVVLLCCAPGVMEEDRRNCFAAQGCVRSYDTGLACLPVVVRALYKELYANY